LKIFRFVFFRNIGIYKWKYYRKFSTVRSTYSS